MLLPLLGPTALPLMHMMGVVEHSTRQRIVRVETPCTPRPLMQNAPAMKAVEEDLVCRLVQLILAPWRGFRIYEARSDMLPPTVLSTSRRAFVIEDGEEGSGELVV